MVFLLCGCDASYKIKIDENGLHENTEIISAGGELYQGTSLESFLHSFTNANIPLYFNPDNYDDLNGEKQDGVSYYTISSNDNKINVKGDYSFSDIYRSRAIKMCFNQLSLQKNNDVYRINTSSGCDAFSHYPLLDKLTIDIETLYDVISSNADRVNNNHYIWELNNDNYGSKYISLVFSTSSLTIDDNNDEKKDEDNEEYNWANEHPFYVILITFASFFIVLSIILYIYRKRR